jgi:hypothetical protein
MPASRRSSEQNHKSGLPASRQVSEPTLRFAPLSLGMPYN